MSSRRPANGEPEVLDTQIIDPGDAGLSVEVVTQSQWGSGYCVDVFVTNVGDTATTWEFDLEVDGAIETLWNAESTELASDANGVVIRVTGLWWNAELAPGATAQFGFCARTDGSLNGGGGVDPPDQDAGGTMDTDPGPDAPDEPDAVDPDTGPTEPIGEVVDVGNPDLVVSKTVASAWNAGTCEDIVVQNVGTAPVTWSFDLTLPGAIQNHWDSMATLVSGTTYTFVGMPYNAEIPPGGQATFGYCVTF